ncbi:28S ribosomal protein S29-like [Homarus americanus]|uniref:Small ribosomal subunit protein mS29 n=1 Tax=Homarus americanus TaxID=6706 RepID=A0A8J5N8C4_HOMAM|nr:28S ribosomal protein S29-like [Homarus americanus]
MRATQWRRNFKEIAPSASVPGHYDHPLDSVIWLQHFRSQNLELLKTLQLETSEQYEWSRRDITEAGVPLMSLVEQGISRARYASDCIKALTNELKKHATAGRCKVALVADGINTFFCSKSRYRLEDLSYLEPQKFTIYQAFMNMLNNDWNNGIVVGSVDRLANDGQRRDSYLPRYVLRQMLEMQSIIDYYVDRHWLQNPEGHSEIGRRELVSLSGCNPYMLMNL